MDELERIIQDMIDAGEKPDKIRETVRIYKENQKAKASEVVEVEVDVAVDVNDNAPLMLQSYNDLKVDKTPAWSPVNFDVEFFKQEAERLKEERLKKVKTTKLPTEKEYHDRVTKQMLKQATNGFEITYGKSQSVKDLTKQWGRYGVTFESGGFGTSKVTATINKGIKGFEKTYEIKVDLDKNPKTVITGREGLTTYTPISASAEMKKFAEWLIKERGGKPFDKKAPYSVVKVGSGGGGPQDFTTVTGYAKEQFRAQYGYFNEEAFQKWMKDIKNPVFGGPEAKRAFFITDPKARIPNKFLDNYDELRFNSLRDASKEDIKKYFGVDVSDDFIKKLKAYKGRTEDMQYKMRAQKLLTEEERKNGLASNKGKFNEFLDYLSDYSEIAWKENPRSSTATWVMKEGESDIATAQEEATLKIESSYGPPEIDTDGRKTLNELFDLDTVLKGDKATQREFADFLDASPDLKMEFNIRYSTGFAKTGIGQNTIPTYSQKKPNIKKYTSEYNMFKARVVQEFLGWKGKQIDALAKVLDESPVDGYKDFDGLITGINSFDENYTDLKEDYDLLLKEKNDLEAGFESGELQKTQNNIDHYHEVFAQFKTAMESLNNSVGKMQEGLTPNNLQLLQNANELQSVITKTKAQSVAFTKKSDYGKAFIEKIKDREKTDQWYKDNPWLGQVRGSASAVWNIIPNAAAGIGAFELMVFNGLGIMDDEEVFMQMGAITNMTESLKLGVSSERIFGENGENNYFNILPTVISTVGDMLVMMETGGLTYSVGKFGAKYALKKTGIELSKKALKRSKSLLSTGAVYSGSLPTLYNHNLTEGLGQIGENFSIGDAIDYATIQTRGEALIELINPEYRYMKGIKLRKLRKSGKKGGNIDELLSPTYNNLKTSARAVGFELIEEISQSIYHGAVAEEFNSTYNTDFHLPDENDYKETILITVLSVLTMRGVSGNLAGGNQNGLLQVASENYTAFETSVEQRMLLDPEHKQYLHPDQAEALVKKVKDYQLHAHLAKEMLFDKDGTWTATQGQTDALVGLLMTRSSLEAEIEAGDVTIKEELQKELDGVNKQIKNQRHTIKSTSTSHELGKVAHEINKLENKLANTENTSENANQIKKIQEEIVKLSDKAVILLAETKEYQVNGKVFDNKADFLKEIKRFKQNGSLKNGLQLNITVKNDLQAEQEANQALGQYAPVQSKEKVVMSVRQQTEAENFIGEKTESNIKNELNEELAKEVDKQNKVKIQEHKNALKYFYLKKSNYKFGEKGFLVKPATVGKVEETARKIRLEKTIDFVENNKKFVGKDVVVAQDNTSAQVAHDKAREEWNAKPENKNHQYPARDVKNADGFVVGDFIVINKDIAGLTDQINVGAHELLHAVTDKHFDGLSDVKKAEFITNWRKTLTKEQESYIKGKINERGDLDITTTREWITIFSDGITKGDITFNEGVFKKIALFFHEIFRKVGYKKEFEDGKQAYNFLKDYQKSVKKGGEISERAKKFYEDTKDTKPFADGKVVPLSMSKEEVKQIEERVTEIGLTYNMEGGKDLWNKGGSKAAIDEITRDGLLDDLIASKYKVRPVPADFVKTVLAQLVTDIRGFNPEVNDDFGGYLGPRVNWRADDIYKKVYEKKGPATVPTEAKTKEGEVKVQIAAKKDIAMKEIEEKDMSITAQIKEAKAKKKAKEEGKKAVQLESEFRNEFGIKTNDEVYNKVLETARVALKRAYEVGTSVRNIQRKLAEEANTYKSPEGPTLYEIVLSKLGTKKDYFKNLEKFRVPIMNLMFTADLVQMEREVADDKKVFTRFVKKLTTIKEVEDAVDEMRLPPSAIEAYERDKSVNEYEKLIPNKDDFKAFFNQPLNIPNPKNPKTTKRSNVRGERKQALARRIVGGLVFDATMQVAQEPKTIEFREAMAKNKGEVIAKDDLQTLAAAIGRQVDVNFSISVNSGKWTKLTELTNREVRRKFLTVLDEKIRVETDPIVRAELIKLKQDVEEALSFKEARISNIPLQDVLDVGKIVQDIKDYKVNDIRKIGHNAAVKLLENASETQVLSFVKNVFRSSRSAGVMDGYTNRLLKTEVLDVIQNGKFKSKKRGQGFELVKSKLGEKITFNGNIVVLYEDITNIKKNARNNKDLVKRVNEQALEAEGFVVDLVKNKDITNGQKIAMLQLIAYDQRGALRKASKMGITLNKNVKTPVGKLTLEHEVTIDHMLDVLIDAVNNPDNIDKVTEMFENAYVHVLPLGIDKVLLGIKEGGASYKVRGGINRYAHKKVADYLKILESEGTITIPSRLSAKQNQNQKIVNKAISLSRSVNNPTRGITVLDFDDTLATTKSKVKFTRPDGTTGALNAEQYASTYEDLANQGYKFDFTEFNKVIKGKKAPLFEKALKLQAKFGPKNMFILTARPMEASVAIHTFLKANGLNIPLKNITGLGNSTAKAKADWVTGKVSEGYNDFYFADDALQNVKAVKTVLNQFDVKSKVQQARVNFSKSISLEFNKIIKRTTGVPTKSKFSDVQAKLRGRKNKYFSIIPASAQDFSGLLYNFLGKGKQGDKDIAFFKKALIDPFARGIDELNTSKQKAEVEYKKIIKDLPDTKKILNDKIDDNFTVDQAIRVYLWNKAGYEIPGLSKRDLKMLDEFVKSDAELMEFAYEVSQISNKEGGYSKPGNFWVTENIGSDLFSDGALGEARATFLTQWQENSDQIFSKDNLNKIEAIYGYKFREALEDILYRMKTGRNRPTGASRLQNEYMNWVNGSVGAIMFFNIRSAVLQTISATNYLNWTDNNPAKAAAAFANQKQFWTDFAMLFNSDYLKQRRSKNQRSVSESELSEAVTGVGAYEQTKAAVRYLLKIGFKPTQIADSFAIASGGATFFRNRVKKYTKEGMSQAEAEGKAFLDFQEATEVSQQSARPDMISQQQASPLGRLILSFQNTPMQYARIMNKAARDLVNGRGDTKTHISKIAYYGVIQSIVFASLQSALFAVIGMGGDEEELIKDKNGVMPGKDGYIKTVKDVKGEFLDKKKDRILNTMVDSWLAGIGYGGKAVGTVKNTVLEYLEQKDKGFTGDHAYTILAMLGFSPPIGSKIQKVYSSIQTEKFNEGVFKKRGFSLDNPIWMGIGSTVEGLTNIPVGRLAKKMLNLDNAMDSSNEWWQRVALVLGWSTWDLGIKDKDIEQAKLELKQDKEVVATQKKEDEKWDKLKKKYPKKSDEQIKVILKTKELFNLSKEEQVNLLKSLDIDPSKFKTEKERAKKIAELYKENSEVIDGVVTLSNSKTKEQKAEELKEYREKNKKKKTKVSSDPRTKYKRKGDPRKR